MKSNTVERVTEWDSEPFTDGHDGLRELADREFSGAATDGNAWLFMLNGRVIGVFGGDIDSFADADGTAYAAPDPSLPLLFAMQETGGETRAEYYTEDTPISEVNETLESGNFTGYVELSENVLSGDYYVAYYGGRSLPVAFVGNSAERLTGDEAFERADGEVGIYQVNTVDLEVSDIPEDDAAGAAADAEDAETDEAADSTEETTAAAETAETDETAETTEQTEATESETDEPATERDDGSKTAGQNARGETTATPTDASTESRDRAASNENSTETAGDGTRQRRRPTDESQRGESAARRADEAGSAEERWRGAKTIPALDPAESVDMSEAVPGGVDADAAASGVAATGGNDANARSRESGAAVQELREERDRLQERVEELEEENEHLRSENERLQGERDRFENERDEANAKAAELEREIEELQATVERLESELSAAESELAEVEEYIPEGDHDITAERALAGTNLFVRYDRKGGATLDDAHDGEADRDAVNDNLRLEHHTDFEDEGAIVEGQPFEEWLHETMEYGFARWLVQGFVHDILETRNQSALGELFDAIPEIDRIEFRGTVELPSEGEEETPETVSFDVVLRDRMGSPLVVADLNDSREPATESMLGTLIQNATPVAKANERLASAFFVTTSYYEPGALETAEEATGGGFLSRDKQKSFVRLSRTGGYHLCLVETREGEFHVSVPEL